MGGRKLTEEEKVARAAKLREYWDNLSPAERSLRGRQVRDSRVPEKEKEKAAKRKRGAHIPTQAEIAAARKNFLPFLASVWQSPGKLQLKWFHSYIGGLLDQMARAVSFAVRALDEDDALLLAIAREQIRRLSVSIPCQHGKSQLCTVYFPAYVLGLCPDARIIFSAATARMAESWSRKVMRVIASDAYTAIFPETSLGEKGRAQGDDVKRTAGEWEIVGHTGSYMAIGVGGAVGGNTADLYIIDDPTANTEVAHSPSERDKQWDWFTEDVTSRGHNDYAILVVASRRHPDDLVGRISEQESKHPDKTNPWKFAVIRAIREDGDERYPGDDRQAGDALWPERHDLARLRGIEQANPWNFQSQFQQNPLPDGGVIFRLEHFKRWEQLPDTQGEWLSSWDCSSGGQGERRSHSVGQVWFRPWGAARLYLVGQVRGQWGMPELREQFKLLTQRYPQCRKHLIEDGGFGRGVYQDLQNQGFLGLLLLKPTGSKSQRAQESLAYFSAGNVYIPPDLPEYDWTTRYLTEMTRFTGAANETNDQVDATTMAILGFGTAHSFAVGYQSGAKTRSSSLRSLF